MRVYRDIDMLHPRKVKWFFCKYAHQGVPQPSNSN
jgi:hypothetical protein